MKEGGNPRIMGAPFLADFRTHVAQQRKLSNVMHGHIAWTLRVSSYKLAHPHMRHLQWQDHVFSLKPR